MFDPYSYRYPSRRNLVYASRGMVATSHPLAAAAGMEILKMGGNAIDAAVATAAALTVVEPVSNGIGSDAFAMIWHDGKLSGINGSGPAPASFDIEKLRAMGFPEVPKHGWAAATVPAAPAVWAELVSSLGRLSLERVMAPAVAYAEHGHAVSVNVSYLWKRALSSYADLRGALHAPWFETFCPKGRAPEPGERVQSPWHAHTLSRIAESDAKAFYTGDIAERILGFSNRTGGFYTEADLASYRPEWVEPIRLDYKGYDVWEMPPNGQGLVALIALGILRDLELASHDCPEAIHRQIEAIKMGFADARRYVADPKYSSAPLDRLLSDSYLKGRADAMEAAAGRYHTEDPYSGGTVYLCTADEAGNMVSYIQSNYMGFGSAVVIPETGIALNNRACCFSMDASHPNALAPGKRPYNTIIPGFLSKGGVPIGPFGVMGGFMQPQGHVQLVTNCVDFGMNPQEALDAPRWQWTGDLDVACEPGFSDNAAQKLQRMGHRISNALYASDFGRGQVIWRTKYETLVGATEPRTDGAIEAW